MIDRSTPGLLIYRDGREKILPTVAGKKILEARRFVAWRDSDGICCLCDEPVGLNHATLEHKTAKGSGGGKHDDRQSNLGISHFSGNVAKGSMSLERYRKLPIEVRRRNCGVQERAKI